VKALERRDKFRGCVRGTCKNTAWNRCTGSARFQSLTIADEERQTVLDGGNLGFDLL